jgi:O-Antigen ligase
MLARDNGGYWRLKVTEVGVGLISIAVILCMFFPRRLGQAIVFFSSFSATAVINFSNYGMSPAAVFVPVYLLWKLLTGDVARPVRISRNHLFIIIVIVGFATLSIVSLLGNQALRNVAKFQLTQTAYLLFGILVTVAMSFEFVHRDRLEYGIRGLRAAAVFISLWGLVQAGCYYGNIPYPSALFNNSSSHFADMYDQHLEGSVLRIASVTVEPSFLAVSLMIFVSFGATLLITDTRFRTIEWGGAVVLALLTVAASTSTTGYFGIVVLAILLGMRRPGVVFVGCLATAIAVTVIFSLLPDFQNAINEVTLAKASTGSYVDRTNSVWSAFRSIIEQPWIGLGWGGFTSYSIVTQLLTSNGGIGTAFFGGALFATLAASRAVRRSPLAVKEWRLCAYAEGFENALLVYLAQSVITSFHFVVADFWCLWGLAIAVPSSLSCSCMPSKQMEARSHVAP